MNYDVAICIPVLNRPHRIEPLIENIRNTTEPPYRVIFAASDQPTIDELDRLQIPYDRDNGDTWPNRINRLFGLTTESYIFCGADDVLFHQNWLPPLLQKQREIEGVVMPSDLWNGAGTLPLVARQYIEEQSGCVDIPGVVVNPNYHHNWAETELRETAQSRDKYAYVPGSVVEHLYWGASKSEYDDTYRLGDSFIPEDREIYNSRTHLWR